MMQAKRGWLAALCGCFLSGAITQAEPSVKDARVALATLQPQLLRLIALSPIELASTKPEFQEYYQSDVEPRLHQIGSHIKPSAIHWLNIDPRDERPELICWTEGLAPTAWGAKEYLFIIKVPATGSPTILKAYPLDDPEPSRGVEQYKYIRFTPYPNKDLGTNEFLAAVFSYLQIGGSSSAFANYEIGWNRYGEEIYVYPFHTGFPVMVEQVDINQQ